MDDDLSPSENRKKSSAKMGRRARKNAEENNVMAGMGDDDVPVPARTAGPQADAPPKPRRMGGWGEEDESSTPPQSGVAKSGRRRGGETSLEGTAKKFTNFEDSDSDNDIPVIPDLEDTYVEEDRSDQQIAMAPSVAVNKVASYKELDSDLARNAQFSTLDGEIDLKLLTRCLAAESESKDDDKAWTWDHLFTEISSDLQSEWDKELDSESVGA